MQTSNKELDGLQPRQELALLLEEKARRIKFNKLAYYSPYPKQQLFHSLGSSKSERLFRAGNQLGKTYSGGMEVAIHLTGRYPDWWEGATFSKATKFWASGITGESTRDNPQRILLGPPQVKDLLGSGAIPKDAIKDITLARGIPDAIDSAVIRFGGGGDIQPGDSILMFKSYEKGREKWQGDTIDGLWCDEEPPEDIYSEGRTRTQRGQLGIFVLLTMTPLLGMSSVVRAFMKDETGDKADVNMTIDDVPHYTEEEKKKIIAGYPAHEREARAKGTPILGSGRIFPISEEEISVDPFKLPESWLRIGGLDFGWDHPTAAVKLVYDEESDTVYVTHAYKKSEATPLIHAATVKPWGKIPWAWPHDGYQHDKGSGEPLKEQYKAQGLNMLKDRATFPDGSAGVEAGLMEMLERMQTGRLKVFSHLTDWFEEFRLYHRKDGKVVKEFDDILSATRYALMMLRFARTEKSQSSLGVSDLIPGGSWQDA